ncbi:MerR family transcriptional regulator [Geotalea uraniireducens]|uniref:Putative transcriptional regulator, MerR family n=1 Tax=Geotalea uraniireducens (strain Rf4) TaxID=351605 RepID=A5GEE0_GEOUR|nr:MerR family transcriptional regulator [Geotalea uraniireducens]ABQ25795.1 putative transcriptional regulator, MerR family [Geotalea uraniireducens Rf4]
MRLSSDEYMQISDLAKALHITTRTIRLYEQMGLVEPPKRTEGGIRVYENSDIKRFKFVLKLKALGLSLQEMKELAELYTREQLPEKIMPRLIELLDSHLNNIRKRTAQLQSLEKDIAEYKQKILDYYNLSS